MSIPLRLLSPSGGIMKYLVLGSGGREHCIAWKLKTDGSASEVYVAPGNGGIAPEHRIAVDISDFNAVRRICIEKKIDIVVVGPEAPLVAGIVDFLAKEKIPVFGPTRQAAMLEGSKLYAKQIMEKYGVPTASHRDFKGKNSILSFLNTVSDFPIVIKLDGLAAGKGVCVAADVHEARQFIAEFCSNDSMFFIEDFIDGEEASVLGISDGQTVLPFIAAQDHKRAFDGDRGPNTGGMGAYAPAPIINEERLRRVRDEVLVPVVNGMKKEGHPFTGILYAGIIVRNNDIKVLEFNVRFGDPETQVLLPLLKNKLGDIIEASINKNLHKKILEFLPYHAITVVMASGGYPGNYEKGKIIRGLDAVEKDILVFHAGTQHQGDRILTSGGRVLNITTCAESLQKARERVYDEIKKISFDGAFYRSDIAHRAIKVK